RAGPLAPDCIGDEYPEGFEGAPADKQLIEDLTAIAGMVAVITDERAAEIDGQLGPPVHVLCERVVKIAGETPKVRIKPYKGGTLAVTDDGDLMDIVGRWVPGQRLLSVTVGRRQRIRRDRRRRRGSAPHRAGPPRGAGLGGPAAGGKPQGAGAEPPCRRAQQAHDRKGPAGLV